MKEKALLINAPSIDIAERHYARPDYPRLALAYLAGYLRQAGILVSVVDAKFSRCDSAALLELARQQAPDLVGFTAMTPEIVDNAGLAREFRRLFPQARLVIGGPHATALPEDTLREFPAFDLSVLGEGELTLTELVRTPPGADLSGIAGLAWREPSGNIARTASRASIANLDDLAFPAWDLFPRAEVYPIIAARGCPFDCNFCMRVNGNKVRRHSPERIIAEIEKLTADFGARKIVFHDESFGLQKAWAHRLLDLMIERDFGRRLCWEATTRVDIADEEIYRKMKRAGCSWLAFGVESGNPEILRNSGKGITRQQAERAVRLARKAGLTTGSLFIIGHPNETRQTIADTIRFARKLPTDTVACGLMVPYPGTRVAEMVERGEGGYRVLSRDWKDFNKQVGNVLEMQDIPRKDLERYQLKLYLLFYLMTWRFNRLAKLAGVIGWRGVWSGGLLVLKRLLAKMLRSPADAAVKP